MLATFDPILWILAGILVASSLGVILVKKPVHASLCFLLTLLTLAAFYLQLHAEFIAIMQVLVYAGAILVIFMFVIILFQDAHDLLERYKPKNTSLILKFAGITALLVFGFFSAKMLGHTPQGATLPENFGWAESLGTALYVDFFFPFEAVILLFLVAMIGALYIAKKRVVGGDKYG